MSDPGWYNAQGDPPGTARYWDGQQWIGEPVYEPTAAPVGPYGAPTTYATPPSTFPGGLRALAIVLSILKALPLFLMLLLALFVGGLAAEFNDSVYGDFFSAAVALVFGVLLAGALLIGFQFVGAIKGSAMMVFVPAVLMTLLDGLLLIGAISGLNDQPTYRNNDDVAGWVGLMAAVFVAQLATAIWAIKVNKRTP